MIHGFKSMLFPLKNIFNTNEISNINNIKLNYKKNLQNSEEKNNKIIESKNIQLILYWANWCGICAKIKPNWETAKNIIKKNIQILK